MDPIKTQTENAVLVEQVEKANRSALRDSIANTPVLIHRDGNIENLERYMPEPLRPRAKATFNEPKSFINYVVAHGEEGTHLFGDVTEAGGHFAAIVDYHLPTTAEASSKQGAQWGEHTARLNLQTTPEWQR